MNNHILNKLKQPIYLKPIFMMAIFTFTFLGLEYFYVNNISLFVNQQQTVTYQNYALGLSAIGFILYSFIIKKINDKTKVLFLLATTILTILCTIIMSNHLSLTMTIVSGSILFILLGLFGSQIYYYSMICLKDDQHLASMTGISYMLGIVIQYVNNNFFKIEILKLCIFIVCIILMSLFINKQSINQLSKAEKLQSVSKNNGLLLVILIVFMAFIFSTLDNAVTLVHASGSVDIGQWPRVFLAVSGLTAGFLYDYKQRKYMDLIMYCMTMLSTICIFVLCSGGSFIIGLMVFYISAGFFAVYFTTTFLEYAYHSNNPELWAGMGRAVNNLTSALITSVSLALLSMDDVLVQIIIILVLFVLISIVISINSNNRKHNVEATVETNEAKLSRVSQYYELTEREQEVYNQLVNSDDSLQEVADKLFISKRTLERHISSIYKKTNAKSRIELVHLYHGQYHD